VNVSVLQEYAEKPLKSIRPWGGAALMNTSVSALVRDALDETAGSETEFERLRAKEKADVAADLLDQADLALVQT
jgi:hypothetical protein